MYIKEVSLLWNQKKHIIKQGKKNQKTGIFLMYFIFLKKYTCVNHSSFNIYIFLFSFFFFSLSLSFYSIFLFLLFYFYFPTNNLIVQLRKSFLFRVSKRVFLYVVLFLFYFSTTSSHKYRHPIMMREKKVNTS